MERNNNYLNLLIFISLILVSIYNISKIGYDINETHHLTYSLVRLGSNLAFPLLLMVFGALTLNKSRDIFGTVKRVYSLFIPSFIFWNIILGILIFYYFGFDSFISKQTNFNWFIWILLSNILVIPILNEFIRQEKENGIKYILTLFFITSILWMLSVQFKFGMYYIDLVFFAQPLCFMVLGYYLHCVDIKMSSTKLFTITLLIFLIVLSIRVFLIIKGINSWNSYFILLYNDTIIQLSVDPFTIIEVSAIFLMLRSLTNYKISNLKLVKFYSNAVFSSILILSIFCLILSKYLFTSHWLSFAIIGTIMFLILDGVISLVKRRIRELY